MKVKIGGRVREIPEILIYLMVALGVVALLHRFVVSPLADTPYYPSLILLEFLILSLVPFLYVYREYTKIREKERYFPQFLKDLADVQRSGLSLVQAVYNVSEHHYGPLTEDVKRLAVRLSWGVSFEEAFQKFAKETKSRLIASAVLIILEAFSSGGKIADILDTVAADIRTTHELREERKARFSPFVGTIYVVFLLSLGLAHILLNVLLPEIPVLPTFNLNFSAGGLPTTGGGSSTVSVQEMPFKILFLHLLIIQAIVSGLLAGIVGEGSLTAGLKHVFIMGFIAVVFFQLVIFPVDPVDRIGRAIGKMPGTFNMSIDLGEYYVEKNITAQAIEDFVRDYRRNFGRTMVPEVRFQEDVPCGPCMEGLVSVKKDIVVVKEPTYLSFRVVNNGDGTVTVFVGGRVETASGDKGA